MTVMRRSFSAPAACSALSACTMTTAPPFMSDVPVPKARAPSRRKLLAGEHGVHVAEQQQPLAARPAALGNEVTRRASFLPASRSSGS
jgi:hypothetical protein